MYTSGGKELQAQTALEKKIPGNGVQNNNPLDATTENVLKNT